MTYDLNAGGAADPTDHQYEHDLNNTDNPEGIRYCWCGWTVEAHTNQVQPWDVWL